MTTLGSKSFQLTNTHDEYVEFKVSYTRGGDYWIVSGIGWMKNSSPKYYLRLLRQNGKPSPESQYKKAQVSLRDSSYKFKNKALDLLTRSGVKDALLNLRDRERPESDKFQPLRPRLPSRR